MVWYGMTFLAFPCMPWYGMVWYAFPWYYGMVWLGMPCLAMVWYGMVWYALPWYNKWKYGLTNGLNEPSINHLLEDIEKVTLSLLRKEIQKYETN
jgi:hypothetical protein